ncbi:19470_t:CDS:2, partial [Funneliformis geosporum]
HVMFDNLSNLRSHIKNTPRIKYLEIISVPFLLGLTCKENVEWLRGFISQHISSFFQLEKTLFHADYQRIIREGLPIVTDGWQRSNEIVQALGVKLMESQNQMNEMKNILKTTKNTDIFLELILNQPCVTCHDINPSTHKTKIKTNGLGICVTKTCILCSGESKYYNQRSEDDFSKCLASAGLVEGVNRKNCDLLANFSAEDALVTAYEKLQSNGQDILEVSFDYAWSHIRKTSQASGEIIFNEELEDGNRITIQEGNYDSNLQQMEHAILITIIEKISTILEKYNIKLNN